MAIVLDPEGQARAKTVHGCMMHVAALLLSTTEDQRATMAGVLAAAANFYWNQRPEGFTLERAKATLPATILAYLDQIAAQEPCPVCHQTGAHDPRCIERNRG